MLFCVIGDCGRKHYAKGLCEKHYQRLRTTGSLHARQEHADLEQRFKRHFKQTDGCWAWAGARSSKGYGVIQEGGRGSRLLLAHRVSYQVHKGEIQTGKFVLHSCDNPSCVNPSHLRIGGQSENIKEAVGKGRKFVPKLRGEANARSKLTLEQVKFIKANPQMKHTELAEMFGLSPNCIRGVRIGRTWKDT